MNDNKWGSYLTDRQWGTVREDYSAKGDAWAYTTHDSARSKAWRWGEEGIGGISDEQQYLCIAPAFWNGHDPIIKERFFGLTNEEGNHGEDVKELYYFLDNMPDHSYMKMLYKYPQAAFPYQQLIDESKNRGRLDGEFELLDTGIFNENRYFDLEIEYAKAENEDILIKITAHNRAKEAAYLAVMPTVWFRNLWTPKILRGSRPTLFLETDCLNISHDELGKYCLFADGNPEWLFCENETNNKRLYNSENNASASCKDGINDFIITKNRSFLNNAANGTKAAAYFAQDIAAQSSVTYRLRLVRQDLVSKLLNNENKPQPFVDFDAIFKQKQAEADDFYAKIQQDITHKEAQKIQRQAFAGMLWCKQLYFYDVPKWLHGDEGLPKPSPGRGDIRNGDWSHFSASAILSMPDSWEYPWFAAWDLAFHAIVLAKIDADFAKNQLLLLVGDNFQHPNGELPAYEWNFSDVNPPVHAFAAWKVFETDKILRGDAGDSAFLETIFQRLLINFQWWVNQKDSDGNDIFSGGFLGLDNIGVFNRSENLPNGAVLEQADATAWVAMFALNMMKIALELAKKSTPTVAASRNFEDLAVRFFEQFLYIAHAAKGIGGDQDLWNDEDSFFYDVIRSPNGQSMPLRVRTMVGLIPLFAVETLNDTDLIEVPGFKTRVENFLLEHPDLANQVSHWQDKHGNARLLSLLRGHRTKCLLQRMLDEGEFLSSFGVRSVSKVYEKEPFSMNINGQEVSLRYTPAESDSGMFGGNSNWRGPIWLPVNYLIIESLLKFHAYYGDDFRVECPVGSGTYLSLKEVAQFLSNRLSAIFTPNTEGVRPVHLHHSVYASEEHFKDLILFYEYFDGDSGRGVGASHQTGWTGLIAVLGTLKK